MPSRELDAIDELAVLTELSLAFGSDPLPNVTLDTGVLWFHDDPYSTTNHSRMAAAAANMTVYQSLGHTSSDRYKATDFTTLAELARLVADDFRDWRREHVRGN